MRTSSPLLKMTHANCQVMCGVSCQLDHCGLAAVTLCVAGHRWRPGGTERSASPQPREEDSPVTAWSLLVVGARTNPFVQAGFDRRTGCGGSGQSFVVRDSSQVGREASWVTLPVASWVMELVFIVQRGQEGSLSVFLRLRAPHVPKRKTLTDLSWRQEVAAPFIFRRSPIVCFVGAGRHGVMTIGWCGISTREELGRRCRMRRVAVADWTITLFFWLIGFMWCCRVTSYLLISAKVKRSAISDIFCRHSQSEFDWTVAICHEPSEIPHLSKVCGGFSFVNTTPQMTYFLGAKRVQKQLQVKVMMNCYSMTTR